MRPRRWLAMLVLVLGCVVGFVAWSWRSNDEFVAQGEAGGAIARGERADLEEPRPELTLPQRATADSRAALGVESRITGRVVNATSGAGLAGFWVKLDNGTLIADTSSNELGWFELPPPPAPRGRVVVKPPWGWYVIDATQTVDARDDQQYAPLIFRARPANSARLRCQIFDEQTGELVPHYLVGIGTPDGAHEHLVSNEQGIFESQSEFPEGLLRLLFNDIIPPDEGANERRACAKIDLEFDGHASDSPHALQIPVGPTYFIDLEAPEEVDRQSLTVMLRGYATEADLASLPGGARTPLRTGKTTWARFRPEIRYWQQYHAHLMLGVRSRDGLWYGCAPVDSTTGIYGRRVAITLEARGHMLGRVRERTGAPIAGAQVSLRAIEQRETGRLLGRMLSSGNGLFEFELLPPGRYLVSAISADHSTASVEVDVVTGRRTEPEITLDRAPIGGAISGRLIALEQPSGRAINVVISSVNPSGRTLSQALAFRLESRRWIGEFRFDSVPAGGYDVSFYNTSIGNWSPQHMLVSPPAEGLEFTQLGSDAPLRVEFIATDAKTGAVISPYRARLFARGAADLTEELDTEWRWIDNTGELDADARWMIAAEGYTPVYGTFADLSGLPARPLARAALERGWGAELAVFGPHFAPLEGASITVDGEPAGATGADGILHLQRASKPRKLLASYRDWRVDADSYDDLLNDLSYDSLHLVLFLAPPN